MTGIDRSEADGAVVGLEHGASTETSSRTIVVFRMAGQEYGFAIEHVHEVIQVPRIIPVPHARSGVEGIATLRGRIVPVLNLRRRMRLETDDRAEALAHDCQRCLVIEFAGKQVALRIDSVSEVREVPAPSNDSVLELAAGHSVSENRVTGVVQLDNGRRLIMILDPGQIISSEEWEGIGQSGFAADCSAMPVRDAGSDADGEGAAERQLVVFRVEDEEFGIDIMRVQEIIRLERLTMVPHAPPCVLGVLNLRGNVLPVIDLRRRLGFPAKTYDDAARVVVLELPGHSAGIVVDRVLGVTAVDESAMEPSTDVAAERRADYETDGIARLDGGERLVQILVADRILDGCGAADATY